MSKHVDLLNVTTLNYDGMVTKSEALVKISPAGTISLPKQFRRHMDMQRGDYVKIVMEKDCLVVRKAVIS